MVAQKQTEYKSKEQKSKNMVAGVHENRAMQEKSGSS